MTRLCEWERVKGGTDDNPYTYIPERVYVVDACCKIVLWITWKVVVLSLLRIVNKSLFFVFLLKILLLSSLFLCDVGVAGMWFQFLSVVDGGKKGHAGATPVKSIIAGVSLNSFIILFFN